MRFQFAWPLCFLLFVPLALAAWRMLRRGRRAGVKFAPVGRLPAKTAGWRAQAANVTPWFFLLGTALLIVAAARPRSPSFARDPHDPSGENAIAIVMAVDVSGSMTATDYDPARRKTRLDVVKELFAEFVKARPDDLIGLVKFGGYASAPVPLTADHASLLDILREDVNVPKNKFDAWGRPLYPADQMVYADEQMTAIGDGLNRALESLKDADLKTKIVILLSDGASNAGTMSPNEAARLAKESGIRVYTIGVGTSEIRGYDMLGRRIPNGDFDERQLKVIAKRTGALRADPKGGVSKIPAYFAARDKGSLKAALDEIDQLEKTPLARAPELRWNEHFQPFLLLGALLVSLAVALQMYASRRLV